MITASSSASNVEIYVQYPGNAFAQACTTMIGQCCGARKWQRCKKIYFTALSVCMGTTLLISSGVYLSAPVILRIFTHDPEVISLALERMRFTLLCKCLQNAMDISVGVTQGYGKTTVPAIFSLVGVCGLRLLWIFSIFPCHPTVTVLFMIYPITWLITSTANLIYYFFIQHRITNLKAQGAAL
jgi:Na+-driven multidrug efflux pump